MAIKINRVKFNLNSGEINDLMKEEIKYILRAADEIIYQGGQNLLAKVLKTV